MAYARTADEPRGFVASPPKPRNARGLFRRFFDAMVQGRRRSAEREIAAYIRSRGNAFTDDVEREIERILSSSPRF
jgi:hypothetical protein